MGNSIDLKGVKNIIFDLGGVILNIDYHKPVEEFLKLGVEDFAALYSQARQSNLFDKLETGKIGDEEFFKALRQITKLDLTDAQIENAWNSIIEDFPKQRIELIERLKANYKVYLLSNTNHVHYRHYNNDFAARFPYASLDELFHKAYFSHKLGLRKPDKEIYEHVLEDEKLIAEETLFVEDTAVNLVEPKKLNILTLLLENGMTIEEIFA